MIDRDLSILFFGSADFPVQAFCELIDRGYTIAGLVTSHDKCVMGEKRLKVVAEEHGIDTYVLEGSMERPLFTKWLDEHQADVFCVISFRYLPKEIYSRARVCAFNIHASMLPLLKGSSPIFWAVRRGFEKTGLTAFVLDDRIDSGRIIANCQTDIQNGEGFVSLHSRLRTMCRWFVCKVIDMLSSIDWENSLVDMPSIQYIPRYVSYAQKPAETDKMLSYSLDSQNSPLKDVCSQIRANDLKGIIIDSYIGYFSSSDYKMYARQFQFKIHKFSVIDTGEDFSETEKHGSRLDFKNIVCGKMIAYRPDEELCFLTDFKKDFLIRSKAFGTMAIRPEILQIPGKSRMELVPFLCGLQWIKEMNPVVWFLKRNCGF